jgi:hypothetical protein
MIDGWNPKLDDDDDDDDMMFIRISVAENEPKIWIIGACVRRSGRERARNSCWTTAIQCGIDWEKRHLRINGNAHHDDDG